jgi:hypothetical protein
MICAAGYQWLPLLLCCKDVYACVICIYNNGISLRVSEKNIEIELYYLLTDIVRAKPPKQHGSKKQLCTDSSGH